MNQQDVTASLRTPGDGVDSDEYRSFFQHSPVPLLVEDFSALKLHLETLGLSGAVELRSYFESQPEEVLRCASLIRVLDVNHATMELLDCADRERLLGSMPACFTRNSHKLFLEQMLALADGRTLFELDADAETFSGNTITVHFRSLQEPGHEDTWSRVLVSMTDISARKETEEQLTRIARFDSLTQLPNRASFVERLRQEAMRSRRSAGGLMLLIFDLDHFKDINDAFGHPAGDAFLERVAARLRQNFRGNDLIARLGGDEFAILQTDVDEPGSGIATRLLSLFEEPFEIGGYRIPTTVSVGIAYTKTGEVDPETMIRQADLALYTAKGTARGTFRFHDETMDQEVHERLTLSHDLQEAIEKHQFFLSLQPQIDLATGRISGFEALVRWDHPERGLLPPNLFVPVAENNGLIIEIGAWVLREACRSLAVLRRETKADLYISVNISPVELRLPDFADRLLQVLKSEGLQPQALELELSERVLMNKTEPIETSLERLHRAGVRFSVDDFGTAYSSMLYLRKFSINKLKIAGSLLCDIETNKNDAGIVAALVTLGHELGLKVLAKGVERDAQLQFLRENDCAEAQGYLFSPPVSLEDARLLLDADPDQTSSEVG